MQTYLYRVLLISLNFMVVNCGDSSAPQKKSAPAKQQPPYDKTQDQGAFQSSAPCAENNCPKVSMSIDGPGTQQLIGYVGQEVNWSFSAKISDTQRTFALGLIAPADFKNKVNVEGEGTSSLQIRWSNPTIYRTSGVKLVLRDVTRCLRLENEDADCKDIDKSRLEQYEVSNSYSVEIKDKNLANQNGNYPTGTFPNNGGQGVGANIFGCAARELPNLLNGDFDGGGFDFGSIINCITNPGGNNGVGNNGYGNTGNNGYGNTGNNGYGNTGNNGFGNTGNGNTGNNGFGNTGNGTLTLQQFVAQNCQTGGCHSGTGTGRDAAITSVVQARNGIQNRNMPQGSDAQLRQQLLNQLNNVR